MKYWIFTIVTILLISCKRNDAKFAKEPETYYTCSMHPQVMRDSPGKCPICGMTLIKAKKLESRVEDGITLSDQQVQLGNISTDTIRKDAVDDKLVLTATLGVDESKSSSVNVRIGGRIEKLYHKTTGEFLRKGEKLYELYSEELNNAKQEYLLALERQKTLGQSVIDFKELIESARNKLLLWGMSQAQVDELGRSGNNEKTTTFYSPADGYIMEIQGHEGDYLAEGGPILRLADLSVLWVEAQVYSQQLSEIDREGLAQVQFPQWPGKTINGKIGFISPEISYNSRINLIRMSVPNKGMILRPGMAAVLTIRNRPHHALSLPSQAVIRNEKHNQVWLQVGPNTYKSKMVEIGFDDGIRVEIRAGLKDGDIVVTHGAYLINSEYIFRHGANPMAGHDMGNMKM